MNHDAELSGSNNPIFKSTTGESLDERYDTKKLYSGIWRHSFLIFFFTLLFGFIGIFAWWYYTHHYQATAVLVYQEDMPKLLPGDIKLNTMSLPTAIDLITLPAHFQAIKSQLGLDLTIKQIEEMVNVSTPKNESHLIRVVAKSSNPHLAIDIANSLANVAIKSSIDYTQKQLRTELDNFTSQYNLQNRKSIQVFQEIEDFKKTHQYFEMTADYATLIKSLSASQTRVLDANLRYASLLVEYDNMKREIDEVTAGTERHPLVEQTENPYQYRVEELENSLIQARSRYSPENPKIKMIEEEISQTKAKMKEVKNKKSPENPKGLNPIKDKLLVDLLKLQGKVRAAKQIKDDLAISAQEIQKQLLNLPAEQVAFGKLLDSKKFINEQLHFLSKATETIRLMINVPKGSLGIYQIASEVKPLKESTLVKLLPILGVLGGICFAMMISFFMEMYDRHFWTLHQLNLAYYIPALMIVPKLKSSAKKNNDTVLLYFIRLLAEHVERLTVKETQQRSATTFMLTSAIKGEGKSFLIYNLAHYYQKIGKKVLILELDPAPNEYNQSLPSLSLKTILSDGMALEPAEEKNDLHWINAVQHEPLMKELIKSAEMANLMERLKKSYDLILIDAPGVIEADFIINLASYCTLIFFLIGAPVVDKESVDQCLRSLNQFGIRPAGFVLNQVLPVYISDKKILFELKRRRKSIFSSLLFWRKHAQS